MPNGHDYSLKLTADVNRWKIMNQILVTSSLVRFPGENGRYF